jgi:hypothetical protein
MSEIYDAAVEIRDALQCIDEDLENVNNTLGAIRDLLTAYMQEQLRRGEPFVKPT